MRFKTVIVTSFAVLLLVGTSAAATATEGLSSTGQEQVSLSFAGNNGDVLTGDKSFSFSHDKQRITSSVSATSIFVSVIDPEGHWWEFTLAAPQGRMLEVGTYRDAKLYSQRQASAGIELSSSTKRCESATGEFEIQRLVRGPQATIQDAEINFKQFCESDTSFASGRFVVRNMVAPALTIAGTVAPRGRANTIDGHVGIDGTVSCSKNVDVEVQGVVKRMIDGKLMSSDFRTIVECTPGESLPWSAHGFPGYEENYQPGPVRVYITMTANDGAGPVIVEFSRRVDLVRDDSK